MKTHTLRTACVAIDGTFTFTVTDGATVQTVY